jgi:nucleotide-binding universal stress UspA family protein
MASKPVVVGVDGSVAAQYAVRWAAERAARSGALLRLIHAYELPFGFPPGATEEESVLNALRTHGRRWLAAARDTANEVASLDVETELAAMSSSAGLAYESANASVLVLGNRGRNPLTGALAGATSLALAAQAQCPLVLVRANGADGNPRTGPIVVGVDGTEVSESAVAFAFTEASAQDATLVAVHAWAETMFETALAADNAPLDRARHRELAEEALAERLAGWQERYPEVLVERDLVHDRPATALRHRAVTARMVVVGRRGHNGFPGLALGSTSQHLLHHAPCPIAVVRTETTE